MTGSSRQILLRQRPQGMPTPEDFELVETPLDPIGEGQLLCRVIYLSIDPYMRGRMDAAKSYAESVEIGGVMTGGTVAEVIESRNRRFEPGDIVVGMLGWQTHAVTDGRGFTKLDPALAPISTALGVLGMPGLTAYVGLLDIGEPKEGETVVVSAASGAVGSVVGQIAKLKGSRAVGIAGSPEKCAYARDELGFDACVSHRSERLADEVRESCPDGIDVYFENVGGSVLEAVLPSMNPFARMPVCGVIASYNLTELPGGPDKTARLMRAVLTNRLKVQGFIVTDRWERMGDFQRDMAGWIRSGQVKYREDVVDGIDSAPDALIAVLQGRNFGKMLVRVSEDPT